KRPGMSLVLIQEQDAASRRIEGHGYGFGSGQQSPVDLVDETASCGIDHRKGAVSVEGGDAVARGIERQTDNSVDAIGGKLPFANQRAGHGIRNPQSVGIEKQEMPLVRAHTHALISSTDLTKLAVDESSCGRIIDEDDLLRRF